MEQNQNILNDKQQQVFQQFKEYVKTQFLYEEGTGELSQSQGIVDDHYLLRFLRARDFDFNKTLLMWNNTQKWRQENRVEDIFKEFVLTELPQVKEQYPHGYHKTDKQGRPVYIEKIGQLNLKKLFEITNEQRLIKYYIQSYESLLLRILPACSAAAGHRVSQTVTILDLKGVSLKMISKQVYNFIQLATQIAQDNYPELLGRMFIVNAPMLFTGIWQVIKPWLDKKTQAKITICGGKYKDKLLEIIDEENLPDFLGGKSVCEGTKNLENNIGCWNPDGKTPLFPGEENYSDKWMLQQEEEQKDQFNQLSYDDDDEEDDEQNNANLDQLKNALLNIGIGKEPANKVHHGGNKLVSDTPLNTEVGMDAQMMSGTPLNTQIDDDQQDNNNQY